METNVGKCLELMYRLEGMFTQQVCNQIYSYTRPDIIWNAWSNHSDRTLSKFLKVVNREHRETFYRWASTVLEDLETSLERLAL